MINAKKYQIFFSMILILSVFGLNCALNIFPVSDDIKLGKQIDDEIRKNPKEYPILQNHPEVKEYITVIGNKITMSPAITKRGIFAYSYEIIANDSVVNAFCTPGGYIYIYTGLLKFVDDEATLAGIIGHEIAHAECRHATKRMTKVYGAQFLLGLILGEKPAKIAEITANLFTGLALLANSRSDETEADEYSIKYLASTEYYPGAIKFFFEKIKKVSGRRSSGTLERLLSTHPLDDDRIAHVDQVLAKMSVGSPSESNIFSERYKSLKSKLP